MAQTNLLPGIALVTLLATASVATAQQAPAQQTDNGKTAAPKTKVVTIKHTKAQRAADKKLIPKDVRKGTNMENE